MPGPSPVEVLRSPDHAQVIVPCADLTEAIAFYTGKLGFRLDMIMPADSPRVAVLSGAGIALRLEFAGPHRASRAALILRLSGSSAWIAGFDTHELAAPDGVRILLVDDDAPITMPVAEQAFLISRTNDGAMAAGRAGMLYRDVIPGRLGGRYIASHIRIPAGGPVPDYVHYHRVRFQMIYCLHGWVRVVYEDQGEPFVMQVGDCVLQPPAIRHRVLEASPGLEVLEISGPAEHETLREHAFDLPNARLQPERSFSGQRFVRHVAANATWQLCAHRGFEYRDTGIAVATGGLARIRVLRALLLAPGAASASRVQPGGLLFLSVLAGRLALRGSAIGAQQLDPGDACVIPSGMDYVLDATVPCEVLEVAL
ncbi:MAG: cupin domain-containing protein [Dokdonella sp.]